MNGLNDSGLETHLGMSDSLSHLFGGHFIYSPDIKLSWTPRASPSQPQGAPVVSQNCPSLTLTSFSFQFDGAGAPFLSESGTGEQRSEILRTERSDSVVRRAARRPDTACHTRTSSTSWPATSARTPRMTRQTHSPMAGTSAASALDPQVWNNL